MFVSVAISAQAFTISVRFSLMTAMAIYLLVWASCAYVVAATHAHGQLSGYDIREAPRDFADLFQYEHPAYGMNDYMLWASTPSQTYFEVYAVWFQHGLPYIGNFMSTEKTIVLIGTFSLLWLMKKLGTIDFIVPRADAVVMINNYDGERGATIDLRVYNMPDRWFRIQSHTIHREHILNGSLEHIINGSLDMDLPMLEVGGRINWAGGYRCYRAVGPSVTSYTAPKDTIIYDVLEEQYLKAKASIKFLDYIRIQNLYAVDYEQLDWVDEPAEIERMAKLVSEYVEWVEPLIEHYAKRVRLC